MEVAAVEVEVSVRNNTPQKHGEYTSVLAADLMLANGEVALVQNLEAVEFQLWLWGEALTVYWLARAFVLQAD